MEAFVIAFIHRALSGLQNGLGYAKKEIWLWIVGAVLVFYPYLTAKAHWLFYLFTAVNLACVSMKMMSFTDDLKFLKKLKDIHLWEGLVTGGFFVWMAISGHNILMLLCSVYPALILHKGFINLGSGLKFLASATDDETGKTYGIPILGIKIPRSSTKFRLIVAGLSILAAAVVYFAKWNVSFDLTSYGS